jgi:hypothetical protein
VEIERTAREAAIERYSSSLRAVGAAVPGTFAGRVRPVSLSQEPIPVDTRQAALTAIDDELVKAGLLDAKSHEPTSRIIAELSWEREELLPTPGIQVKGCLDRCDTCEPALKKKIELELEEQTFKNKLLERQIELLDKAQEYRCCPEGQSEDAE